VIGLLLLLTGSASAEPVKDLSWLNPNTLWTFDDPVTCKDHFSIGIASDVAGNDYVLEVGLLTREGWFVDQLDVTNPDGTSAQIEGKDLVMVATDCTTDRCAPQAEYPAPEGYQWTLFESGTVASADGDSLHQLVLSTVTDVGGEEAVGSLTASYISTNSWIYGDTVKSAYREGVLVESDWNSTEGNIHVSGGTANTVVHGCSHSPGPTGTALLPLWLLALSRFRRD
jgi:hypothetical protein